jgi:hypothetical protein
MPIVVTERAVEVLRRALEAGRLDPEVVGIRVWRTRDGAVRTGFAEEPEPGDDTMDIAGIRLFIPAELAGEGRTLDVSSEHDRIVLV